MADEADNGAAPTVGIKFQVMIVIDTNDRLQLVAPDLPLDRVDVIVARAHDWTRREMDAQRTAEVLMERQRRVQLAGGPVKLPPPPGGRG